MLCAEGVACCHGDAIYQHTIAARVAALALVLTTFAALGLCIAAARKVPRKPRRGAGAVLFCAFGAYLPGGVTVLALMATAVDKEIDDVEDDGTTTCAAGCALLARRRCHIHDAAAPCSCYGCGAPAGDDISDDTDPRRRAPRGPSVCGRKVTVEQGFCGMIALGCCVVCR